MRPAPLAIAVGDPAGVGPMVAVTAAARLAGEEGAVLFGDAERLRPALEGVGVRVARVEPRQAFALAAGEVGVAHVARSSDATVSARGPTVEGGRD